MKIYSRIIAVAFFFFVAKMGFAQAQDDSVVDNKHAVGFSLGTTGSGGFAYKYYGEKFRLKGNLWGIANSEGSVGAFGMTGYLLLKRSETSDGTLDFCLYQSNSCRVASGESKAAAKSGFGAGIEKFTFDNAISVELMGGVGFYNNYEVLAPAIEMAVYYRF